MNAAEFHTAWKTVAPIVDGLAPLLSREDLHIHDREKLHRTLVFILERRLRCGLKGVQPPEEEHLPDKWRDLAFDSLVDPVKKHITSHGNEEEN